MAANKVIVNAEIDGNLIHGVCEVKPGFGKLDTTLPSDAVYNVAITDRRSYRVATSDGMVYEGKCKGVEWREMVVDADGRDTYLVIIETVDEWPDPCITCGLSHDTLDCGKSILPHPYHPEVEGGW